MGKQANSQGSDDVQQHGRRGLPDCGFTLMEILVTVTIIGVLAATAFPAYSKSVERAHWRAAQDTLMTIYTGEQVYFEQNNKYVAFGAGSSNWLEIFMDDPNTTTSPVAYSVALGFSGGFGAQALRNGGVCGGWSLTLDGTKTWTGSHSPPTDPPC
jgi:type IV pilus assembly protein PilE